MMYQTGEHEPKLTFEQWYAEFQDLLDAHDDAWMDSDGNDEDCERLKRTHAALLAHAQRIKPIPFHDWPTIPEGDNNLPLHL